MRLRFAAIVLVSVLLAGCGGGAGGTGELPEGDHVHSLGVTTDGELLLGLHGGLYRSDRGVDWELVGLEGEDAMAIAAGDEPMFVAGHDVLYRSDDGGETFSALSPPDLPGLDIHGFAQAPTDGDKVYAYVVAHGLYASEDAGASWEERAPIGALPRDVFGLAVVGSDAGTLLMVGPESGILRSDDGGRSFVKVYDVPTGAVAVDRNSPEVAWALTAAGLARSDDSGRTWQVVSAFDRVEGQPVALVVNQPLVWVVTEQPRALYRSNDAGVSWQRVGGQ